MRINFTRHLSIRRLAALALLALYTIQLPGGIAHSGTTITAQPSNLNDDEIITLTLSVLIGVGREQTIRFTVFNPREPDSRHSRLPLRAQVKLFDAQGSVIAESEELAIAAGEFRWFDFKRRDIALGGEEGTGRLQVRGTIRVKERREISEARGNQIPTSIELVNNNTGTIGDTRTIISANAAYASANAGLFE